jgi:hypothetical protein
VNERGLERKIKFPFWKLQTNFFNFSFFIFPNNSNVFLSLGLKSTLENRKRKILCLLIRKNILQKWAGEWIKVTVCDSCGKLPQTPFCRPPTKKTCIESEKQEETIWIWLFNKLKIRGKLLSTRNGETKQKKKL